MSVASLMQEAMEMLLDHYAEKEIDGDVRNEEAIAAEMLWHMEQHSVKSVAMTDGLMGCPHQEGIDYEGEYCPDPACAFWHGRDRFTHKLAK